MKNNMTFAAMNCFLPIVTKKAMPTPAIRKAISKEYRRICTNAKDIGSRNQLLSCYALAAWYIAMNRCNGRSPQENYDIMEQGFRGSRLFRLTMGSADHYLNPKRVSKQKKWAQDTHKRVYENDWVVDVLPGNGEYDLGYDYLECGICKLCRDEGCFELAKYLCKLDFVFADVMGMRLERTCTLADGGEKCDFRFHRKP